MKLYLLMYLFFAESSSDPNIQKINALGKVMNDYSPIFLGLFLLGIFGFVLGIFLFHNSYIIKFGGLLIKLISPKFSDHLLELADALQKKRDYKNFEWMKNLENLTYSSRRTFEAWMQKVFTKEYSNNVTALAYFGASLLILIIGLRGIRIFITIDTPYLVIFGILLEVSMLALLAFTQFYTPENPEETKGTEAPIEEELKKLRERLRSLEGRLSVAENSLEDAVKLVKDSRDLIDNTDQDIWTISKR
jgi:hypothetical protein